MQQQQQQQMQQHGGHGAARFWPSPRGWVDSRLLTRLHRVHNDPGALQEQPRRMQSAQQQGEAQAPQQQRQQGGNAEGEVPHDLVEALEASWMGPGVAPPSQQPPPQQAGSSSAAAVAGAACCCSACERCCMLL